MRTDLIWRAALPVAAVLALLADAPQAVTGGLALAGLALATERLVRLRATSLSDRVLVGVGGAIAVLVLTGMLMGSTEIGLSPTTWVVAVAVLSAAGLVVAALVPGRGAPTDVAVPDGRAHRRTTLLLVPWLAVAGVVVAFSVTNSATSLTATEEPPVQMSFGTVSGTRAQVVITASTAVGPLQMRTNVRGRKVLSPIFVVAKDGTVTFTITVPTTGRALVKLKYPGQSRPLRTLILDR